MALYKDIYENISETESLSAPQERVPKGLVFRKGDSSIFDYLDNLIPNIALPISQLPDLTQKTTCTQNVAMDVTFHLRYVPAFKNVYIQRKP